MSLVVIDFESFYSKDYSLSKMTTEEYIRSAPFQVIGFAYTVDYGEPIWVTGTDTQIANALHGLELHKHAVVAHNATFDCAILAFRYGIHPKTIYDTLSMAKPLADVVKGGSLAHLSQKFGLGEKGTELINGLGKRREDFTADELARYAEYCKNDVVLCRTLFHVLQQHSTPQECYVIDMLIRMYTDPVIHLNRDILTSHLANVQRRKELLLSRIDSSIGRDALMSNPKFAEVLQKLGAKPPTKISPTTGKETWAFAKTDLAFKALEEHDNPLVQAVVAARLGTKSTLEETRTERFIATQMRGPLPIMLNYYGAHTGRASGGEKLNLQNLTRGSMLRMSMEGPPGHSVVACDSAQIEARVTAWLAGQRDLVQAFHEKKDIYSEFASEVYGEKIDRKWVVLDENGNETFPHFEQGFVGKTAILGLGFGCGAKKFLNMLQVKDVHTLDEPACIKVVNVYRSKYSMIAKLWKDANAAIKAMASGYEYHLGVGIQLKCNGDGVHLPNGMIQRYPNLRYLKADGDKIKQDGYYYDSRYGPNYIYGPKLVENVVQALARIVVFNQMCKIDQHMRRRDSRDGKRFRTALTVHDEVVVICPDEHAAEVKELMVGIMSTPPAWAPDLPIACEAGVGKSYGNAK